MLALLSPAKKLDLDSPLPTTEHSQSDFLTHTEALIPVVKKLKPKQVQDLMGISDALTTLNHERFQELHTPFTPSNARPAALTFNGEVYTSFDAPSLSTDDLLWAQDHVRILSGLYGMLRPLDLIQAYRLEMGTKLKNPRGKSLYDFWRKTLTPVIDETVAEHTDPTIVNLASTEYSKAINLKKITSPIITPVFQDIKEGKARVQFLFAKRARGAMTRWMVQNRIEHAEGLKDYNVDGYRFVPKESTDDRWVFQRPQPPPPSK